MPSIETSDRYNVAVLWPLIGFAEDGQPVVGPPGEIRVRWENVRKEMTDPKGNVVIVEAVVVVNRSIEIGSQMWEGPLDSWMGTGSVGDDTRVMTVATQGNIPDVKSRARRRVVGLTRLKDSPTTG